MPFQSIAFVQYFPVSSHRPSPLPPLAAAPKPFPVIYPHLGQNRARLFVTSDSFCFSGNDRAVRYSSDQGVDGSGVSETNFSSSQMSLAELLAKSRVTPVSVYGDVGIQITGIQHDSREVAAGDLFVCCRGAKTDGHLHVHDADERGAVAIVAARNVDSGGLPNCKALVIVEDTNAVLPILAAMLYDNPSRKMSVVGITGTNGKTTTAHLVKGIYEAMDVRAGMLGTIAYHVLPLQGDHPVEAQHTTPDAVMVHKLMAGMVHNGAQAVVMEVSSHGLALGRCDEVDFDVAVFMNLTREHFDFHGTEEEYRNCKGKLFRWMVDPKRHRKVFNIDDPAATFFVAQGSAVVPVVTFAMDRTDADVHPLEFKLSLSGTWVLISTPNGNLEIASGLIGRHNIYNILAAVAVGVAVGIPLDMIAKGIEMVNVVSGRFELVDEGQTFPVIVDYAHTPDAMSRVLDAVRELGARRIITVIGCRGERDKGKRPMMAEVATDRSDVVILTSDNPGMEDPLKILDDMLAGVGLTLQNYMKSSGHGSCLPLSNGCHLFLYQSRKVAIHAAIQMGKQGDIIVVTGKGHETYQIEGDKKDFFDDREECRKALRCTNKLYQAKYVN